MNGLCDQFFSGAGFAVEQDADVGGSGLSDLVHHMLERRGLALQAVSFGDALGHLDRLDFFHETGDFPGFVFDGSQFDTDIFLAVGGMVHVQDTFGLAGSPAFRQWTGFAGAVAGHVVVVRHFITGSSDHGCLWIAVFPESLIDRDDPVLGIEKNMRFGLCLEKRGEFGKWHGSLYGLFRKSDAAILP